MRWQPARPFLVAALLALTGCSSARSSANPPAPGFDAARSDPRAVAIADQVMEALGGRAAWDATRVIEWRFKKSRRLCWDRATSDFRLDEGGRVVLMNLATGAGRVFEGGEEVLRDLEKKRDALDRAYKLWVNDSYWLLAPYKLKDSGVRLGWKGEGRLEGDRPADILRVEFSGVGVTPDNAYDMWVARDTQLVERWSYYKWNGDAEAAMTTPWSDWRTYGAIRLASDHGLGPSTDEIVVHDTPPARLHDASLP